MHGCALVCLTAAFVSAASLVQVGRRELCSQLIVAALVACKPASTCAPSPPAVQYTVQRRLGGGSYKTVWAVDWREADGIQHSAAVSCEKLSKARELRAVRTELAIADALTAAYGSTAEAQLLEQTLDWWVQKAKLEPGMTLTPTAKKLPASARSGAVYLCELKPLYNYDLQSYIDGRATVLSDAAALRVACDLLQAGQCLHAAGVLHRDIKPSNCSKCTFVLHTLAFNFFFPFSVHGNLLRAMRVVCKQCPCDLHTLSLSLVFIIKCECAVVSAGRGVLIDFGLSQFMDSANLCSSGIRGEVSTAVDCLISLT
jgi:serine/threonine protein kinase